VPIARRRASLFLRSLTVSPPVFAFFTRFTFNDSPSTMHVTTKCSREARIKRDRTEELVADERPDENRGREVYRYRRLDDSGAVRAELRREESGMAEPTTARHQSTEAGLWTPSRRRSLGGDDLLSFLSAAAEPAAPRTRTRGPSGRCASTAPRPAAATLLTA